LWKIVIVLLLLASGITGIIIWKFHHRKLSITTKWEQAIPPDAIFVIQTGHPTKLWKQVHKHPLFRHISQMPEYDFLRPLDSLLYDYLIVNKATSKFFEKRDFAMSAHLVTGNDYDFLYVLDMQALIPGNQIMGILPDIMAENIKITKITKHPNPIWKVTGLTENPVYVGFFQNLALMSFSHQIIRRSLLKLHRKTKAQTNSFQNFEISNSKGLARIYFNYRKLPEFLATFGIRSGNIAHGLSKSLQNSVLALDQSKNLLFAEGITLPDTSSLLFKPFVSTSGNSIEGPQILPEQTLLYASLHVNDFAQFYRTALQLHFKKQPQQKVIYMKYKKSLKKWIGFDWDKDFIAWIGGEIGIAQFPAENGKNQMALLVRADDIDFAKEKLELLNQKLRNRTPVKFKNYDYEGYTIHYLAEKKLFEILFGKWTNGRPLPYYTIIKNFVVFSDSEKSLERIINAIISFRTLSRTKDFRSIASKSNTKNHLQILVNIPGYYTELYKSLPPNQRKSFSEWYSAAKALHFAQAQWTAQNRQIKTKVILQSITK